VGRWSPVANRALRNADRDLSVSGKAFKVEGSGFRIVRFQCESRELCAHVWKLQAQIAWSALDIVTQVERTVRMPLLLVLYNHADLASYTRMRIMGARENVKKQNTTTVDERLEFIGLWVSV
jgi:hypothetical protein